MRCWCGNRTDFQPLNEDYACCLACGTANYLNPFNEEMPDAAFYGENYWTTYQQNVHGFPTIFERAKIDLTERCLYWLDTLVRYQLPGTRVLEVGAGHGGFLYLLEQAGYAATGIELNQWVVDFAHDRFGVDMLCGPLRAHNFDEDSFDVVVMMDVLEHISNPVEIISSISEILSENSIVLIQTPRFGMDVSESHLKGILKAPEHVYLYSQESISRLLAEGGFHPLFLQALYPYDMFVVAKRGELSEYSWEHSEAALMRRTSGIFLAASISTFRQQEQEIRMYREAAEARLAVIESMKASEEQVASQLASATMFQQAAEERLEAIEILTAELDTATARIHAQETALKERLEVIERLDDLRQQQEQSLTARDERIQTLSDGLSKAQQELVESHEEIRELQEALSDVERQLSEEKQAANVVAERYTETIHWLWGLFLADMYLVNTYRWLVVVQLLAMQQEKIAYSNLNNQYHDVSYRLEHLERLVLVMRRELSSVEVIWIVRRQLCIAV